MDRRGGNDRRRHGRRRRRRGGDRRCGGSGGGCDRTGRATRDRDKSERDDAAHRCDARRCRWPRRPSSGRLAYELPSR